MSRAGSWRGLALVVAPLLALPAVGTPPAPRPLALSDAAESALRKEIARRKLPRPAADPLLDALRAADPWVELAREAAAPGRVESASALAYLALDRAAMVRGVPAGERAALADPASAAEQLEDLAAQMRVIEDAEPSIPEAWRAALAQLVVDLARARRLAAEALAPIGPQQRRAVSLAEKSLADAPPLLPDLARLHRSAATALLATDAFLALLPPGSPPSFAWRTDRPGVSGPALGPFATVAGPLFLGGVDRNEWALPADAIVVDLGGDDLYRVTDPARVPERGALFSVIVDLDGRDGYHATRPGALGGALFGVSLLRDERGDDRYDGTALTQGAALCGVGLLVDGAGNDRYSAERWAQGAAAAGFGVLADGAGDDSFLTRDASQGFGGAAGVGVLAERHGDDLYRGGFAQAVATGADALGVLLDADGADVFLSDGAGQASAAQGGRAILVDGAGADLFRSRSGGGQASAREGGSALLLDLGAGEDTFLGGAPDGAADGTALRLDEGPPPAVRVGVPAAARGTR